MEGAEARVVLARPAQLDRLGHEVDDVEPSLDFLYAAHVNLLLGSHGLAIITLPPTGGRREEKSAHGNISLAQT
jgi:hypothetical protein